jgi:subtilisin
MRFAIRRTILALSVPMTLALIAPVAGAAPNDAASQRRVAVIVLLADGVSADQADEVARDHDADLGFVYEHALEGFSADVPEGRLAGLRNDRRVELVELDQVMTAQAQTVPTGVQRIGAETNTTIDIDRADDQRVDVDIAIVDTGIDAAHEDLHVVGGTDCSGGSPFKGECTDGSFADGHGHGTHVAGSAAALDNGLGVVGVAPGARLWGVKVLGDNGSGYTSWILAGIDWVIAKAGSVDQIEVLNMSLGGSGVQESYREAINTAVEAGVTVVVAAGNSSADASNYSPAFVPSAITVSALADSDGAAGGIWDPDACRADQEDTFADFSNFGNSVDGSPIDLIAPGVCILSTVPGGYATYSGTSMAAPHVAGAAALLRSAGRTHAQAETDLTDTGSIDWDSSDDGDPVREPLLDVSTFTPTMVDGSGSGDGPSDPTNSAPTASFTYACTDLACDFSDTSTDSDGTIASYSWDFGDGSTGTGPTTSHTYAEAATYTVTLTVTDDAGAKDTESQSVSVSASSDEGGGITLSASGYKVKGVHHVDLEWSGAISDNVAINRDGAVVATTANDGAYTDNVGNRGGGSYTYQVCETGSTTTCSAEVTVTI